MYTSLAGSPRHTPPPRPPVIYWVTFLPCRPAALQHCSTADQITETQRWWAWWHNSAAALQHCSTTVHDNPGTCCIKPTAALHRYYWWVRYRRYIYSLSSISLNQWDTFTIHKDAFPLKEDIKWVFSWNHPAERNLQPDPIVKNKMWQIV